MEGFIRGILNEYEPGGGVMFGGNSLNIGAGGNVESTGFLGSFNVAFIASGDSINVEAPGCIVAPLVNMVAKNSISLGMAGQGEEQIPVRLFVPKTLTIAAKDLSIGDVRLLANPERGYITCDKLTLSRYDNNGGEDPAYFEVVKSWVVRDETEIEIIQ